MSSDEAIDVNESTQIRGLMSTTEASTTKSSEEGPGPNIDIDLIKPLAGDGTGMANITNLFFRVFWRVPVMKKTILWFLRPNILNSTHCKSQ